MLKIIEVHSISSCALFLNFFINIKTFIELTLIIKTIMKIYIEKDLILKMERRRRELFCKYILGVLWCGTAAAILAWAPSGGGGGGGGGIGLDIIMINTNGGSIMMNNMIYIVLYFFFQ